MEQSFGPLQNYFMNSITWEAELPTSILRNLWEDKQNIKRQVRKEGR